MTDAILKEPPFDSKTYERGFVVGAIGALHATREGGWAVAAWVTANILGMPVEGERPEEPRELLETFIKANNDAVERLKHGRK